MTGALPEIRPGLRSDAPNLREIERRTGEQFRSVGMHDVADDEPMTVAELTSYIDDGRCWVAAVERHGAVGYILAEDIDGAAHIEQVSVLPELQGRGVGRQLITLVESWAVETGRRAVTLTTFDSVPWNRPLYEHLGFQVLAGHEIGPGLRARMAAEAAHGLDPALRVAMRRDLRIPAGAESPAQSAEGPRRG